MKFEMHRYPAGRAPSSPPMAGRSRSHSGTPPRSAIARASDPGPADGQVITSHTFKAAEKPPDRSFVITTESPTELGRITSHSNPTPAIRVQPVKIVSQEPIIEAGAAIARHGQPTSTPPFAPPPRGLVVVGRESDPFAGSVTFATGHVPGLDEEYNYADPDLSSLIVETATDPFDIDPDRSSLIVD